MEDKSNQTDAETCQFELKEISYLVSVDVITILIGIPVVSKLMWITFTSNKPADILNFNLALYHKLQYFLALLHLISLYLLPRIHTNVLKVLLVYAQTGGPMSLCFITMERYVAVIYPTSYYLLNKYRCREACVVYVWLFSLTICLVPVYPVDDTFNLSETFLKTLPFYVMVVTSLLMFWCSVHVARALLKSGPGRDVLHPMKKRAFKTVCATMNLTLFCYIPVAAMQRFKILNETLFYCKLTPVCIMLLSIASVIHPLFYLFSQGQLFACLKYRKKTG